ncbi:hypothetical protein FSP39_021109 [Pinctada imbricata]|uniref:C2H2-type domain-containing protein n=1 Tax=Pinctada imbricata TaxID=66713 RepID=A0AA88YJJ0_PINIB|nr:hypothetical protein FSP39_021109 [Pinctada imbricata]
MSDDTNSTSDESFNIGSDSDATEEENTEDKKLETRRNVRYEKDLKEGVRTNLIQIPVSTGSSCEQKLCNNAPTANISVPAHVCVKNSNVHFLESENDIRSKLTNTFSPKSATDLMYDTAISKRTQQNHNGFPLNKTINSPLKLNAVVKTENVSLAFEGQVTSVNFPRVSKVALSSENLPYVVEGAVTSENLSRISEGAVISENLSRIPEGAVTSENLSRIPEGAVTSENLSRIPEGAVTSENLSRIPEGAVTSENLSRISEGAVTSENLSRIPEGAVTSEGDKEMFIDQTSNLRQGKIVKNKKGIKFEFIFGEEGTFERCEIDNPILKMCVHDNSEAFRNCFKYMEWNCYMRCFHCEEVFERFSEYIFHSFGSEQCGDENKREVNGVVNGRWKACRMCGRQAFTKYKWLEHMLKDKIHGPEKKCAFIPKSAVLDPKEINGADFRKLKRNKRLQNKGKEDKRDKNAQVQPKLIQTDSESLKNFIPGFQCKVCGQSADIFPNLCDAVNHIKEVHTSEEKTPLKYAKVVSDDGRKVIVAEKMEDTKPSFLCSQCGNTYSCKGTLVIHLASAHKDVPSEKLGITDKTKKCPHCDKTFSVHHNRYYNRHLLIHTGPVTCKECNRLFKHKAAYLRHAIAHNGKQYICDKCGKVHESYINYRNHLNNHLLSESVRKFKCETCGKFFMTQNHLNTHARIHLPDRPFKCAHCDATFKFKNHLKNHLRSYCPKMKN